MKKYYVSLVGVLLGCFLEVETRDDEDDENVRIAMNCSKLQSLWCSVYPEGYIDCYIRDFGYSPKAIIPCKLSDLPIDWYQYERLIK